MNRIVVLSVNEGGGISLVRSSFVLLLPWALGERVQQVQNFTTSMEPCIRSITML